MEVSEAQEVKQLREENAAEALGRRSDAGQRCIAIGDPKKLSELVAKRAEVRRLKQEFDFSERHACELMSIPRSSYRYRSRRDDSRLRAQLIELAREKPRFGYRRLYVLLRRAGQHVNHKRVQRVYRAAGLCVRRIRLTRRL